MLSVGFAPQLATGQHFSAAQAMKLSFSQCSQPSQTQQTPSVGLSKVMSRFGLSSQLVGQLSEAMLTQEPLAECGYIMDVNSSQLSQPLW